MKILYIILGDLGRLTSGSGLRPACMYQAFLDRGHTVYVLSGYQGRDQRKQREAEVRKAMQWAEENAPDCCYIESSTYPMIHECDYEMFRFLHKKKIPSAYFYRDFHRRFPDIFVQRKGLVGGLKEKYLDFMQWRTDRILNLMDVVYFPSRECFPMFRYRNMKALPPAGHVAFLPAHENTKTCIYVGGILGLYGLDLMLDAFAYLNREETRYRLILVCRESEFKTVKIPQPLPEWLEVHHASGKELEPLYARSDLGLITLKYNDYAHLSICIKLFQYLCYGLPVLSTDVAAMTSIIRENGFGEVAAYDAVQFGEAIRKMLDNDEVLASYRESIENNMTEKNLWVHRVDQILQDLTGEQ